MTTGQILFYSGAALMAVTVLLAVIFYIKKPIYRPENAVYAENVGQTQQLRNGYPTNRLTISHGAKSYKPDTAVLDDKTKQLHKAKSYNIEQTEILPGSQRLTEQQLEKTEKKAEQTVLLSETDKTEATDFETVPLNDGTMVLADEIKIPVETSANSKDDVDSYNKCL